MMLSTLRSLLSRLRRITIPSGSHKRSAVSVPAEKTWSKCTSTTASQAPGTPTPIAATANTTTTPHPLSSDPSDPYSEPNPDQTPYLLSYRARNSAEDARLDTQHGVITHAILSGHLVHPSIPISALDTIADIACGTGIWLDDVQARYPTSSIPSSSSSKEKEVSRVGFDLNPHAFDAQFAAHGVRFVEHDCTKRFPEDWRGKFGLVNMRGLAYAVPRGGFEELVRNVVELLRPGGYIQWLETDTRLFEQYPCTSTFKEAITTINTERGARGLVDDMPHFMLTSLLPQHPRLTLSHYALLPGGISRSTIQSFSPMTTTARTDPLNLAFSRTVLESVALLLAAPLNLAVGKDSDGGVSEEHRKKLEGLIGGVREEMESGGVVAGGKFPFVVARKEE